jgi:hypothetical protein
MTGALREDRNTYVIIHRSVPLRMRNVSDKGFRENYTHILLTKKSFSQKHNNIRIQ